MTPRPRYGRAKVDTMVCGRCGTLMRLLNKTKGRLRVYFCPECSRFSEAER